MRAQPVGARVRHHVQSQAPTRASSGSSEAERTAERFAGDLDLDDWSGLDIFSTPKGALSTVAREVL